MFARALIALATMFVLAGSAAAEKATLAVLGLEVAGSIDQDSTSHGRLLTDQFRARIASSAHFAQAPNSQKDLLDEKVTESCDNEAPACMAKIGGKLKAQYLMYGKIEKRPKDGKDGYQLAMKFLDVDKKTVKEWGDWIPLGDIIEASTLDSRVATAFDTLSRDVTGISPAITPVGPVGPIDKPKSGFPWKATAVATSAVTLIALGSFAYHGLETRKLDANCRTKEGATDLSDPDSYLPIPDFGGDRCSKGPTKKTIANVSGVAAAAFGGIALFAVYKGFIAKKESPTQTTAGKRTRKKKQFSVTPIISPDSGGATFRLDW